MIIRILHEEVTFFFTLRITFKGTGEMAELLRALSVLPEDCDSIPSTHMAVTMSVTPRSDTLK